MVEPEINNEINKAQVILLGNAVEKDIDISSELPSYFNLHFKVLRQ